MISRRGLLGLAGAALLGGCKRASAGPATCADGTELTATEVQTRNALAYIDTSPQPGKDCAACQQYLSPPSDERCGTCKLLKGPVHPRGYCKAYAAKG